MIIQNRITADWESIKQSRTKDTEWTLRRENKNGLAYKYVVGDYVLILLHKEIRKKLDCPTEGP